MKTRLVPAFLASMAALSSQAVIVNFSYSQSDFATGSGTIAPFSFGGHDFTATPLPAATVVSPGGAPPAGFVSSQTIAAGAGNEANVLGGLTWSGAVTATATDGATISVLLQFAPKQTQAPTDISDYNWAITFGDDAAAGVDTTSTSMRFMILFSRDTTADATETANTFQRYTQQNHTFAAGVDNFTQSHTSSAAIKDATDGGAPAGTDAAGRDLAFYYGWRDQGALTTGSILLNQVDFSGILVADENTLVVPEPSTALLGLAGAALLALRRRR